MTLNIGGVTVDNPFMLAPMAGVNCTSFRLLCKEMGAGLIYTQMYHCNFLVHKFNNEGAEAVKEYINIQEEERPVAIQLVGNDPEKMANAAKIIEKYADIIDVNFGCPDEGMIKAKCGAYFSKHDDEITGVLKAVIDAVDIPVTAKIRIGWDGQSINGVKVAQEIEKCGAAAIAIHGRTAVQKYAGKANWTILKQIKDKLTIPVIGNGDVNNAGKAIEMIAKTGVDGVMIGRRTMGDPTIFRRVLKKYKKEDLDIPEVKDTFKKFIQYYKDYDSDKSFSELRTHALWFSKRAALGPKVRSKIAMSKTIDEILEYFLE